MKKGRQQSCHCWTVGDGLSSHQRSIMGAKNQTKKFEGGDLGYDLGKIWCILAGNLG